jgi:MFS family permease
MQFLPFILLALPGGHVADRFDRRVVLLCTHAVHALSALLLLGLTLSGSRDVRGVYAVLVLFGAGRAFSSPAGGALVPLLVPREHFSNAVTWNSTAWQVATIVGPALGGLLYGAGGPSLVYGLSAGLAALAFLFVLSLSIRPGHRDSEPVTLHSLMAGFRYVWSQRLLLGSISMDLFAVLLGGAVALLPIYAKEILAVGPWGLGLLRSAPAAGAACMAVALAFHPLQRRAGQKLFVGVAVFGLATLVFGVSRNVWLSLLALFVLGAADMVSVVVRATLEQLATPDDMRGRVSAVNGMFIGASNELGEFESGITAKLLGTVPAVVAGGVGTLVVVAAWARLFPELRAVDRLEDAKAKAP